MSSLAAARAASRMRWIPPPVQRLVEPYLPPPTTPSRRIPPIAAAVVRPSTARHREAAVPAPQMERKVYMRRGVSREGAIKVPARPVLTLSGVKARLRSAMASSEPGAALWTASSILDDQSAAPSSSDLTITQASRVKLYNTIIYEFLHHLSPSSLVSVYTLFQRQTSEGLPVDPQILTIYLKAALASASAPMQTIASIFPFLPQTFDLHLLTLILSTTVRHARSPPEEVKSMIHACLAAGNGGRAVPMAKWDLELWDVYVGALLAEGQIKEGIRVLPVYQAAVWAQAAAIGEAKAEEEKGKTPTPKMVCRVHISLLAHWIDSAYPDPSSQPRRHLSARRSKNLSTAPRSIVIHALQTLRGAEVPVELLNAWMAAEVVARNYHRAGEIWEVVSGLKVVGSAISAGEGGEMGRRRKMLRGLVNPNWQPSDKAAIPAILSDDTMPDSSTYTALFRLLKRSSTPPTRRLLRAYLSEQGNINIQSLNGALSTIFTTLPEEHPANHRDSTSPDLPAALVLLRQFSPLHTPHSSSLPVGQQPSARTLDIVAAGLARLSLHLPFVETPDQADIPLASGMQDLADGEREYRLSLKGWDKISHELHLLRGAPETEAGEVVLPVGRPLARLVSAHHHPSSRIGGDVAYRAEPDLERNFEPAMDGRDGHVRELLPALEKLLKRAIGAQIRANGGDGGEEGVEEALELARREMGVVRD